MYTVTRQVQWPEGAEVVEVSLGSLDYANPDMLQPRYPLEGSSFHDPREAAAAAMDICRRWREDGHKNAKVAYGATGGMTMPFPPCTFQQLRQWARTRYQQLLETLPPCDSCGDPIWEPEKSWWVAGLHGERFCSQKCAEDAYEAAVAPETE